MEKTKILLRIYGADYMEYLRLDTLLYAFNEGASIDKSNVYGKIEAGERCTDKLLRDGYIKDYGSYLKITCEGLLFRATGGYSREFIRAKRSSIGFWLSIVSVIIACASFAVSVFS